MWVPRDLLRSHDFGIYGERATAPVFLPEWTSMQKLCSIRQFA